MAEKKPDITEKLESIILDWEWLHQVDGPTVRDVCIEALHIILRRDNQLRLMRKKYEK
jgi:hypothetical protein